MRCCPRCGEKYDDTDIRSMCASCMVSLVPVAEAPAATGMDRPGPVALDGAAPTLTVVMPEVRMPEVRMPDLPQPAALPVEVPQLSPPPDAPPAPEPGEPVPVAQTAPTPPSVDLTTLLVPPVIPPSPPASSPAAERPPARLIAPAANAGPGKAKAADSIVRRALTAEERGASLTMAVFLSISAFACTIIVLALLVSVSNGGLTFFGFLCLVGLGALDVFLIRQVIYRATVQDARLALTAQPLPGSPLKFDVTVGTLRPFPVSAATVTLEGRERAVHGSGKSKIEHLHTFFSRALPLSAPPLWPGDSLLAFHPQLQLPVDAVPSFAGKSNQIEWFATLHVAIPGWFPDIRRQLPIAVPALRIGTPPATALRRYALPNLGDLGASFEFECAAAADDVPALSIGTPIPFTLTIAPAEAGESRKLWVELVYLTAGSGNPERVVVDRVACFRAGWSPAMEQRERGQLILPSIVPVTYNGRHIRISWAVNVRMEIPWLVDRQQALGVVVVSRDVAASA